MTLDLHKHGKKIHTHVKQHHKKYILGGLSSWLVTHLVLLNIAVIKLILIKVALFSLTSFGVLGISQQQTFAHAEDIKTTVSTIENDYNLEHGNIYDFDKHQLVEYKLENACNTQVISVAKIASSNFVENFKKSISNESSATQLDKIDNFYKKLSLVNSHISSHSVNTYCKQKYILHNIQDKLQTEFSSLLEEFGLAGETLLWNSLDEKKKKILLPTLDSQLKTVQEKLKSPEIFDDFEVNNISLHELGTEQTQVLKEKIMLVTENTIKNVLADMLDKNILNIDDIKMLGNKINVRYLRGCKATHGTYTISREFDGNRLVNVNLKNLTVNVNLCPSYEYLHELSHYVEDIFSHELGHHVYYFKDKNPRDFEKICRNRRGSQICKDSDFVSKYSMTKSEEDYAETFLHWYKNENIQKTDKKLKEKFDYFSNLYSTSD